MLDPNETWKDSAKLHETKTMMIINITTVTSLNASMKDVMTGPVEGSSLISISHSNVVVN
jgi:hypothetical protein